MYEELAEWSTNRLLGGGRLGIGTYSFLCVYIRIVCGGWELTVTCMHLETLIGGRGLHTKILMVFYQTWLERDSAKLKESGGWSSV